MRHKLPVALAALLVTGFGATKENPGRSEAGAEPALRPQRDFAPPAFAPEFLGRDEDWINTPDGKALKMKKGSVYCVDFWEYTCVNCLRTLPYLKEWHKRYADKGLILVGIHTPEFAFAKDKKNVAQAVKELGITWPVLNDSEHKNWQAYNNAYWPRKYFVDRDGKIVYDHAGEGDYQQSEARIQQLLKQINPALEFPAPLEPVRDTDKPGAVCYPVTPELYAGERGYGQGQFGNLLNYRPGVTRTYADKTRDKVDGRIYARGLWKTERESLRHARDTPEPTDYVAIRYHALEANAVIRPEKGEALKVYLLQDGKPLRKEDSTQDTRYDEKGQSYLLVDTPRMYRLTKNAKFGYHTLKMATASSGFGLYAFTFSSCEVK